MKLLQPILFLLLTAASAEAQTITLGPITKTVYCVGDTMVVPYTASGTFKPGNFFTAQMSDDTGSFAGFTNVGHALLNSGAIAVPLPKLGSRFRVRVSSTDPYMASADNGVDLSVSPYPSPILSETRGHEYLFIFGERRVFGLAGEPITFTAGGGRSGDTYQWVFHEDAVPIMSTDPKPTVVYSSDGVKTATLTVTNSAGCSTSQGVAYLVASCNPQIPANTYVVRGNEGPLGYTNVLVKAGANYVARSNQTIFVEAGGALNLGNQSFDIIYMLKGASLNFGKDGGSAQFILASNSGYTNGDFGDLYDTVCCSALSFDYSLLGVDGESLCLPKIQIDERQNDFQVRATGATTCRIFSLLGTPLLSQRGDGSLDVDLTQLPAGMYFAIVQAGEERVVRKIVVAY